MNTYRLDMPLRVNGSNDALVTPGSAISEPICEKGRVVVLNAILIREPSRAPCARMLRTRRSGVRTAPPPLPLKLIYSSLWVVWRLTESENGTGNAANGREDGRYTAN